MNSVNATKWLDMVLEEAKGFDASLFPPIEKMADGEKVIGTCPEELRVFYSYQRYCQREMKQALLEIEFTADSSEKSRLEGKFYDMRARANVCQMVLWSCINEALGQWSVTGQFRVRVDWNITFQEVPRHDEGDFFRRIIGGTSTE